MRAAVAVIASLALTACRAAGPPAVLAARPGGPTAPAPVATELAWAGLIGQPEDTARQAIVAYLGVRDWSEAHARGVELYVEGGRLDTIFLHIMPELGDGPTYAGPLFDGLTTASSRDEILAREGEPDQWGADRRWFKYVRPDAQRHFEWRDGELYMVTFMRPDWQPGD